MKLSTYIAREIEKTGKRKTVLLKEMAKESGVSLLTLQSVEKGATLRLYVKAKAISQATGGEVSVEELCNEAALEVAPVARKPKPEPKKAKPKKPPTPEKEEKTERVIKPKASKGVKK